MCQCRRSGPRPRGLRTLRPPRPTFSHHRPCLHPLRPSCTSTTGSGAGLRPSNISLHPRRRRPSTPYPRPSLPRHHTRPSLRTSSRQTTRRPPRLHRRQWLLLWFPLWPLSPLMRPRRWRERLPCAPSGPTASVRPRDCATPIPVHASTRPMPLESFDPTFSSLVRLTASHPAPPSLLHKLKRTMPTMTRTMRPTAVLRSRRGCARGWTCRPRTILPETLRTTGDEAEPTFKRKEKYRLPRPLRASAMRAEGKPPLPPLLRLPPTSARTSLPRAAPPRPA
mmetsp:Transcript_59862/g.177423  ORF Transcript_59862/g.177423 Transcript_59862/m.177423 type:complete len:280 (+) Transcript_59862:1897-2736(+)